MSGVSCQGQRIFDGNLVETGKLVYVKVVNEQALSKAMVVWLEDGGGLRSEPTSPTYENLVTTLTWGKEYLELMDIT
jgi:hypothetical protein